MTKHHGTKAAKAVTKRLENSATRNGFWPTWWRLAANHNQVMVKR